MVFLQLICQFGINVKRAYRFSVNSFMFSTSNWSASSSLSHSTSYFWVGPNKSDCSFRIPVCIGNQLEDLVNYLGRLHHGNTTINKFITLYLNSNLIAKFQAYSNIKTQTDWFPFMWIYCNCRKRNFNKSLK